MNMARWGKGQFLSMIILLAVSFGACSEKQRSQEDILSKEQFTHLLIEIHLLEAKLERVYVSNDSSRALFEYFQNLLFEEEGIDSVQFNKTLAFYKKNPKPFKKVYEAVTDSLMELEVKGKLSIRNKDPEKLIEEEMNESVKRENDSTGVQIDSLMGSAKVKSTFRMKKKGE